MKKFSLLTFILSLVMVFNVTAFASSTMTFEQAKEYLQNYHETRENDFGEIYTVQYIFDSEEDLNKAAIFIVENGLDEFNNALDKEIAEYVKNEETSTLVQPRTAFPSNSYETVSGDGTHQVEVVAGGLASFDTLGTLDYRVELGYRVTVRNGKFVSISSISFDVPYVGQGGSWGELSLPSYCTDYNCGVTANYVISKSVDLGIGDFGITIKTETDKEYLSLETSIE